MRVALIHNPGAGDDTRPAARQLKSMIRNAGHDLVYRSLKSGRWKTALDAPVDLIAVAGGDGTVANVARQMIGKGVPLAILPLGTANNISKTLGIADVPIERLIEGWPSAHRKRFDSGVVTGPWKVRHFVEGVGAGLFALALPEAERNRTLENLNDAEVKATYAKQLLRDRLTACPPTRLHARLDGNDVSGDYLLIEAMNMRFVGPNLYLAPQSSGDDGLLDVVLIEERHRARLGEYIATWQEDVLWPPDFTTLKGCRLEIDWTGFLVHIDDVLYPRKPNGRRKADARIAIEVERNALEFLVPQPG